METPRLRFISRWSGGGRVITASNTNQPTANATGEADQLHRLAGADVRGAEDQSPRRAPRPHAGARWRQSGFPELSSLQAGRRAPGGKQTAAGPGRSATHIDHTQQFSFHGREAAEAACRDAASPIDSEGVLRGAHTRKATATNRKRHRRSRSAPPARRGRRAQRGGPESSRAPRPHAGARWRQNGFPSSPPRLQGGEFREVNGVQRPRAGRLLTPEGAHAIVNDPSGGSPTEIMLRLILIRQPSKDNQN